MRVLTAIFVLLAGSLLALSTTADAARKYKRVAKSQQHTSEKQRPTDRQRLECARARQEDPTGQYASFPCWAREAFGRANRMPDF